MIIAIGANLFAPDDASPHQSCERAVRAVAGLAGVVEVVRSRWFSSAPVPPSGQPRYINGVLRAGCTLAPGDLLAALQAIEQGAGRHRSAPNAARTLDLDIIDFGGLVRSDAALTLPHPRAHLRGFVLYPLRDVAPGWRHPVSRKGLPELIRDLAAEDIHQL